jgi:zinc transporter 9
MAQGSRRAVAAAIAGNSLVTVAKTFAFVVSGSAAMLSEALHSLADTLNQILLMVGIVRSSREADHDFPYGYGAERQVWALMSAVGIFFLGCGVTVYHGVHTALHPEPLSSLGLAKAVLVVAFVVEAAVLIVAVRAVWIASGDRPFFPYLAREADPAAVAVVLEDAAACLGVLLAFGGILMSRVTGDPRWDAVASILIGLLLGAIAIWLIARNRHLLVGPAIPEEVRDRIREVLKSHPAVEKVAMLRTRMLDADTYRVAAEVEFAGEAIAASLEDTLREAWPGITDYESFRRFAADFADDVVERLGDEVDGLEAAIRREVPRARWLDVEAD